MSSECKDPQQITEVAMFQISVFLLSVDAVVKLGYGSRTGQNKVPESNPETLFQRTRGVDKVVVNIKLCNYTLYDCLFICVCHWQRLSDTHVY